MFAEEESSYDQSVVDCLQALLEGDYTVYPQGSDEFSQLVRALVDKLAGSTQEEMSRVVSLSIQANETAIFSAQMLSNLRKVDGEAQGIASAAEEMVATVQSIGTYGTNISEQASEAQTAVSAGAAASRSAVEGMQRITNSVQDSVDKVNVLAKFSEQIGRISEDIKKIADKTNLLALNATIEAARAGEAGKGFAVVAGEVKSLASQTRQATEEISSIIENLQTEMRNVLLSMKDSSEAVVAGQEAISRVGEEMEAIHAKIDEVSQNTAEIASTLSEQSQASQEVSQGITKIAASSGQSVEGIERIVSAMDAVEKLISAHIAKLAELNVPGKVVKLAQSDHVIWKKRLANMIVGREGLKPEELADHHTCRLGKWYDNVDDPKYKENPEFKSLIDPHKLVHEHGIQAVRYFNDGQMDMALAEIEKVEAASKDVLQLLAELESV